MPNEITFTPNREKAVEVIVWFCNQKKNNHINRYNLLKALFYAEVEHLNHFGRPIIGDKYMAMKYGTVPSLVRDLIEKNRLAFGSNFIRTLSAAFDVNGNLIEAKRFAKTKFFSKSDIQCMQRAYREYGSLPFDKLRDLNHEHVAWKTTWEACPNGAISFDLLIEDESLKAELLEDARHMVV